MGATAPFAPPLVARLFGSAPQTTSSKNIFPFATVDEIDSILPFTDQRRSGKYAR